jgi:hypothetical protein
MWCVLVNHSIFVSVVPRVECWLDVGYIRANMVPCQTDFLIATVRKETAYTFPVTELVMLKFFFQAYVAAVTVTTLDTDKTCYRK